MVDLKFFFGIAHFVSGGILISDIGCLNDTGS
jgi:hypothetical protein